MKSIPISENNAGQSNNRKGHRYLKQLTLIKIYLYTLTLCYNIWLNV